MDLKKTQGGTSHEGETQIRFLFFDSGFVDYKIGVMIFLGYFLSYIIRYNLSVHVVGMVVTRQRKVNTTNASVIILREDYPVNHSHKKEPLHYKLVELLEWDDLRMAKLFASYHIGYCVCFPIFHSFGDRIGPTWVVGIAGMTSGILSCLTPASAYVNFWTLFIVRMITGFCAGAMQPSMVQVLKDWVPPIERNHFMWAYCGVTTGTCCTFLWCAAVEYYSHWPVGFYVSGAVQITWATIWVLAVTDSPRQHPYISDEERDYLISTIGTFFTIKLTNSTAPWRLILLSVPFWAICVMNFGYSWMIISLCIHGPLYYAKVLEYNIYDASALVALPFFVRLVVGTVVIQSFHWYKYNPNLKRVKHIRRYFVVISHVIPGVIVASCWIVPGAIPGPVLLTIAVALTAAGMDMTLDLCYELTPNFGNSVYTVVKIIGNTAGILVSLCTGQVTQAYKNTVHVWKNIWCFHALILFLSGLLFLARGETHVQPWNFNRVRPQRRKQLRPKVSRMSNIIEMDEDTSTLRMSQTKSIQ